MARLKKVPLHPWETVNNSKESRYIRLGASLFDHPAFIRLTHLERDVYISMINACAGKPEFKFPRAYYEKKGFSKTSVQKAVKGLTAAGFIEVKEQNWTIRKPNVYRFADGWKARREPP